MEGGIGYESTHITDMIDVKLETLDGNGSRVYTIVGVEFFKDDSDFECVGDEVLVESSPPESPARMAARLATPAQAAGSSNASPGAAAVRELIVIPEMNNTIDLQHAIQQVSSTVAEVKGDSSGQSSPSLETQHAYITVAMQDTWKHSGGQLLKTENLSDPESEGGNGVNYHVQYVEPQDLYAQSHQPHMETLRTYPVYEVATVDSSTDPNGSAEADSAWGGNNEADFAAYGVVVAGDEAETPASPSPGLNNQPPRMPPATVQWLLANYETADGVSLPRSTLYAHYLRHCTAHRLDPVNAASFGKLIRSVYIGLRTRRLGTRGNSKYHYYGIRAKANAADTPPRVDDGADLSQQPDSRERESIDQNSVIGAANRQYLGDVSTPEPPELVLCDDIPSDDIPPEALQALHSHYKSHGTEFLQGVAALDIGAVERSRRAFWRRPPPALCRRLLLKMTARKDVCAWLRSAEFTLHQAAVELLLPDVLQPIPAQLTQAIRNFAKSIESCVSSASAGAPQRAARAQAAAAAALAAALRRYTSLNHLAQAARAVLINQHQIQQMLSDLNRVDFRVVREQAAWACACGNAATANKLEGDFKANLNRGANLEQWAGWLANCVRNTLSPHERKPDYSSRARRLLLDWSFYSSLVIRELTLRSAASFGSFHLLRLLYDEYVAYLIERRVAAHELTPPIAVMHKNLDEEELDTSEDNLPPEVDEEDPDWEWADDDEEEDDMGPAEKKQKIN